MTFLLWDIRDNQGVETAIYCLLNLIWMHVVVLIIYLEDILTQLKEKRLP